MDIRSVNYQLNENDGTLRSLQAEIGWQGKPKEENVRLGWYGLYSPELEESSMSIGAGEEGSFVTAMWVYTNLVTDVVEGFEFSVSSKEYSPLLVGQRGVQKENMTTRQIELPARDRARFTGLKGAVNSDGQIVQLDLLV